MKGKRGKHMIILRETQVGFWTEFPCNCGSQTWWNKRFLKTISRRLRPNYPNKYLQCDREIPERQQEATIWRPNCNNEESELGFSQDKYPNDLASRFSFSLRTLSLSQHPDNSVFSSLASNFALTHFWKEEQQIRWDLEIAGILSSFLYAPSASSLAQGTSGFFPLSYLRAWEKGEGFEGRPEACPRCDDMLLVPPSRSRTWNAPWVLPQATAGSFPHTCAHVRTCEHTHTRARARTHTHVQTCTHTSVRHSSENLDHRENAASWNHRWNVLLLVLQDIMETDLRDCWLGEAWRL